ncbi:MAG: transcriptional activator NhaR [Gemmataceae bacterium]
MYPILMDHLGLNYHHLLYFWVVAREGGIARACDKLYLAQPTISGQLRRLERAVGHKLLARAGRGLALTETGRLVYRYAEEIFSLGGELVDALNGRPAPGQPVRLVVGVADVLAKMVSYRLLEPALRLPHPVQIVCREDKPERLLAELSVHGLDLVLSDGPVPPAVKVKAFNHLLGECGVTIMAAPALAKAYRRGFPSSLNGAPFLLPAESSSLRRLLDGWFDVNKVRPAVRAEFDDSALLKVFGQQGVGLFAVPDAVEGEIRRQYNVHRVGRLEGVRERFYAISVERRLKHPAVLAISLAAQHESASLRTKPLLPWG